MPKSTVKLAKTARFTQLPTVPGDITTVTFPSDGGNTFIGWKCGKLYFGISLSGTPDNGISSSGAATTASADRLAFLLGKTVAAIYTNDTILSAGNIIAWNGSAWASSGSSAVTLAGFIVN